MIVQKGEKMKIIPTILLLISVLLFFGAFKYVLALTRPGMYPPKQILKKRAGTLAAGGGILLLMAIILANF